MSSFRPSAGILTARAARRPGSSTQTSFDEGTAPSPSCLSRKGEAGEATPRRVAGASESRPVARALERRSGAIDRLLGVMAADQHEPDRTAVLHPAGQADRRVPGDVERAGIAGRLPAAPRDLLRRCVLAG